MLEKFHFNGEVLQPFDVLICKSGYVIYNHYIIYLGEDRFLHNVPLKGVHFATAAEILDREVLQMVRYDLTETQKKAALQRVDKVKNFEYDVISFNCEHLINYILFNKVESSQYDKTIEGWRNWRDGLRLSKDFWKAKFP